MSLQNEFTGILNDPRSLHEKFLLECNSNGYNTGTFFNKAFAKIYSSDDESSNLLCYAAQYSIAHLVFNQILADEMDQPYINEETVCYLFKLTASEASETKAFSNTSLLLESLNGIIQNLFVALIQSKFFRSVYNDRQNKLTQESLTELRDELFLRIEKAPSDMDQQFTFRIISSHLLSFFFNEKHVKMISNSKFKAAKKPQGISFRLYDKYGSLIKQQTFTSISSVQDSKGNTFIKETNLIKDLLPTGII